MTPMLKEAVAKNPSQLDKVEGWTPMGRLASAEEVADPIVFLCLPASSYITGQVLGIDGGLTAQGFNGPTCERTPDVAVATADDSKKRKTTDPPDNLKVI